MDENKRFNPKPKIELSDDDIDKLRRMSGLGMTMEHMSAVLGFSKDTLERRMRENPRVDAAIKKGRAETANEIAQTAYNLAKDGNVPMTIFWLKTRLGWKEDQGEKQVHEVRLKYRPGDEPNE